MDRNLHEENIDEKNSWHTAFNCLRQKSQRRERAGAGRFLFIVPRTAIPKSIYFGCTNYAADIGCDQSIWYLCQQAQELSKQMFYNPNQCH